MGGEGFDRMSNPQSNFPPQGGLSNSQRAANPQPKNGFPTSDEARRKQADKRRPMIMRRILVWSMDEKLDLEERFRKQLERKQLHQGELSASANSQLTEDARDAPQ